MREEKGLRALEEGSSESHGAWHGSTCSISDLVIVSPLGSCLPSPSEYSSPNHLRWGQNIARRCDTASGFALGSVLGSVCFAGYMTRPINCAANILSL